MSLDFEPFGQAGADTVNQLFFQQFRIAVRILEQERAVTHSFPAHDFMDPRSVYVQFAQLIGK